MESLKDYNKRRGLKGSQTRDEDGKLHKFLGETAKKQRVSHMGGFDKNGDPTHASPNKALAKRSTGDGYMVSRTPKLTVVSKKPADMKAVGKEKREAKRKEDMENHS